MNIELLKKIGLTESQSKAYIALVKYGNLKANELAEKIEETRTNAYMILDRLVDLGLANKDESSKVLKYYPTNPTSLERLIENKRKDILTTEKQVRDTMPQLLSYYYTYRNQPGVRFFQGKEGIMQMYEDQRRTSKDIYFISSQAAFNLLGDDLYKHIEQRAKLGIKSYGIEPAGEKNIEYGKENDKRLLRDMIWAPIGVLEAPVNLYVYGDKTALISFEEEVIGTIIESPKIAQAMKQLFDLAKQAVTDMNNGKDVADKKG
jgi:sugar-specific transcriptional regulator TrmB